MATPYDVWLRQVAYDYLETLDQSERYRLLDWLSQLAQHPYKRGDFSQLGASGRECEVAIVATHAIVWWVDTPVHEIKVVEIRSAD